MECLTMRNDDGLVVPTKLDMEYISKMPLSDWDNWLEILNRLRDYEETGLSPDEIDGLNV